MADPKLKEAMAEIKAIFKKHDIGGFVTLVSETHGEFRYELEPSWSVMHLSPQGQFRFKSILADFKNEQDKHRATELSVHLICQIRDLNVQSFRNMQTILEMLEGHMEINHTPYRDFEPHRDH